MWSLGGAEGDACRAGGWWLNLLYVQNLFALAMPPCGAQRRFANALGAPEQRRADGQRREQKKIGEIQVHNGFRFPVVRCTMISVGRGRLNAGQEIP